MHNLQQRLRQHQADVAAHGTKYRPWKLKTYLAFENKATAMRFESYLKYPSGRAFRKLPFDWWLVAFCTELHSICVHDCFRR
jgi:predicted GIY-YIG superfamily endonuclease